ncbi:unnamed protein product [Cladocopium goreaui]|uniref:Uncharacterized protein n=1 Tax=Cladocopium goreaui TaxID=2562237 RepID=A0A9P1BS79_9DINO|nr:unnamed protein product [Cladocopium goreaui]
MAATGLANFFPSIICAVITAALLIAGLICTFTGGSEASTASELDVDEIFLSMGQACRIVSVTHRYDTKRESRSISSDSSETVEFCQDHVVYTFSVSEAGSYAERPQVSSRGEVTIPLGGLGSDMQDRCQGAGGYQKDLVCNGLCQEGQEIECWRPMTSCTGSCETTHAWAKCSNTECYKIIDPKTEQLNAQEGEILQLLGVAFLVIGAGAALCTCGLTWCIIRRQPSFES